MLSYYNFKSEKVISKLYIKQKDLEGNYYSIEKRTFLDHYILSDASGIDLNMDGFLEIVFVNYSTFSSKSKVLEIFRITKDDLQPIKIQPVFPIKDFKLVDLNSDNILEILLDYGETEEICRSCFLCKNIFYSKILRFDNNCYYLDKNLEQMFYRFYVDENLKYLDFKEDYFLEAEYFDYLINLLFYIVLLKDEDLINKFNDELKEMGLKISKYSGVIRDNYTCLYKLFYDIRLERFFKRNYLYYNQTFIIERDFHDKLSEYFVDYKIVSIDKFKDNIKDTFKDPGFIRMYLFPPFCGWGDFNGDKKEDYILLLTNKEQTIYKLVVCLVMNKDSIRMIELDSFSYYDEKIDYFLQIHYPYTQEVVDDFRNSTYFIDDYSFSFIQEGKKEILYFWNKSLNNFDRIYRD